VVTDLKVLVIGAKLEHGTTHLDLRWAFDHFDREMTLVANFEPPCTGQPRLARLHQAALAAREPADRRHRGAGRGPPLDRVLGIARLRQLERWQMAPARWQSAQALIRPAYVAAHAAAEGSQAGADGVSQ
jgi:hypothetical protein